MTRPTLAFRRGRHIVSTSLLSILALTAGIAGCGSSHATGSPASSTTLTLPNTGGKPDYQKTYRAIVVPANRALATFIQKIRALPSSPPLADIAKIAEPLADAVDASNRRLEEVAWPSSVAVDMRALVAADNTMINDLRNVKTETDSTVAGWGTRFADDQRLVTNRIRVVLTDIAQLSKA